MFSARLSLPTLIELCRVLKHYLGAGLSLPDVFRQQEKKGPAAFRPVAGRIAGVLADGGSLESALKDEAKYFPPLFISLTAVGERTGMMPEVFGELERYFLRQQQLRRTFISLVAWPVLQFVMATGVLALLIIVFGFLAPTGVNGKPLDPLGLGLFGVRGAVIFLAVIYGGLFGLYLFYRASARLFGGKAVVDRFLLSVPAIGPCLAALALGRFCLALRLTHESGMSVAKALRLSLRATGNSAYEATTDLVEGTVKAGDEISLALSRTGLFNDEFVRIVGVAEESGTLSEVMKHQGDHYHDEAGRRMKVLTAVAGFGLYALIGILIIIAIFRLYIGVYLDQINQLLP